MTRRLGSVSKYLPTAARVDRAIEIAHRAVLVPVALLALFGKLSQMALTAILLATFFTIGVWLVSRAIDSKRRLKLRLHWQALAWTHYRQILAEIMIRSIDQTGDPRFDFVTFYNGRFESMLNGGFYSDLQYVRGDRRAVDLVVFDIEYLPDLLDGSTFGGDQTAFRLVPFDQFAEWDVGTTLTSPFDKALLGRDGSVCALPIRWGFNGVALRLSPASMEIANGAGYDFGSKGCFDLSWLLNPEEKFHQWLATPESNCWVVVLDWYLPIMGLIAQNIVGAGWASLHHRELRKVKTALHRLNGLMHPTKPFVKDPLELAEFVREESNIIVLGGGNWLTLVNQEVPENLTLMPCRHSLLWCECVGFMAPSERLSKDWILDANRLLDFFAKRRRNISDLARFSAFAPDEEAEYQNLKRHSGLTFRELPPANADAFATRRDWEAIWEGWRDAVARTAP